MNKIIKYFKAWLNEPIDESNFEFVEDSNSKFDDYMFDDYEMKNKNNCRTRYQIYKSKFNIFNLKYVVYRNEIMHECKLHYGLLKSLSFGLIITVIILWIKS